MKSLRPYTFLLACVLISGDAAPLFAANMRSFIESVRRKAPVVYVGSVKEVRVLQRTKFDIKTKAVVDINAVMRTVGSTPAEATIEYSSYDDKTPMLEGGPQYQLRPGVSVIVFANSSTPTSRLDISLREAVGSCCSGLTRYAMLLAKCLPTNSRLTRLRRTIAVFR
jgi:hypothetical protein